MMLERCKITRLASVSFLFLSLAAVGSAQGVELSVTLGESLFKNKSLGALSTTDATSLDVGDGFRIGARFTFNTKKFLGHEFGYAYSRSKLEFPGADSSSMPTHQGFYDLLGYLTP